jgi:hypothetical protein
MKYKDTGSDITRTAIQNSVHDLDSTINQANRLAHMQQRFNRA